MEATEQQAAVARPFTDRAIALALFCVTAFSACTVDNAKRHYVLAERLWTDGKYQAAVSEFEKVAGRDPRGKLGTQALLRAAMTQALFLAQYPDAIEKLKRFADLSQDAPAVWDARKQIGDLLFSKTEQYDQALQYYQDLVKLRPDAPELPEFLFRIGRSQYFLGHFDDAVASFRQITTKFPQAALAERADFEIAQTHLTQGEQIGGARTAQDQFKAAMASFQGFLKQYPKSQYVPEAQFGIASCLEAMDQLDAAYQAYEALRSTYPSKNVIEIKLARIRERKAQRSR